MEQTKESKFIESKNKPSIRQLLLDQNSFQSSNQFKAKKNNLSSVQSNNSVPTKTQKDINKEKSITAQQNQAPKNIWISSIRDIIRDEPIKITHIKKQPAPANKNTAAKASPIKPKKIITGNQSSKPVFTISATLKSSMQQQTPKIKNGSNNSQNHTITNGKNTQLNTVENKPIIKHIETPILPPSNIIQTNETDRISPIFHPPPSISPNRCPSPKTNQSNKIKKSQKSSNRKLRCISVLVFLIVMFLILFFAPYLL